MIAQGGKGVKWPDDGHSRRLGEEAQGADGPGRERRDLFDNHVVLAPQDSHELVAYLALTGSLDGAKRYSGLASL